MRDELPWVEKEKLEEASFVEKVIILLSFSWESNIK